MIVCIWIWCVCALGSRIRMTSNVIRELCFFFFFFFPLYIWLRPMMQWRHKIHCCRFYPNCTEKMCIRLESERAFSFVWWHRFACIDEMTAHCFHLMLPFAAAVSAFSHRISLDITFCGLWYLNLKIWCYKVRNLSYEILFCSLENSTRNMYSCNINRLYCYYCCYY